ncbi:VanZ family protein [Limnobacter humi]|uniref:VanZ family protein n=1 Tax=Limnobacter humi TaxID=1778671 RepID=A0ABT1WCZ3_9BURK|nr:VanZ family protein [Limnobacter humi]MCQ8895393.1 VanZ family protein [Limnobacter humi]
MPPIHDSLSTRKPYQGLLMFAALYTCVVVHLSLYPYANWRSIGIGPFEFLSGPWIPIYQTVLWTDIAVNVLGYVPLGFLLMAALNRRPSSWDKIRVLGLCVALSFSLESLQTYLPTRVPSKMDWLTNGIGAALGIILAMTVNATPGFAARLNHRIEGWLIQRAWLGMITLTLWFLCILAPQNPPFSTGLWLGNLFDVPGPQQNGTPFGLPMNVILMVEQAAPNFINYCTLTCAWLIGLAQTQAGSPRLRLSLILMSFTLLLRAMDALVAQPANAWWYQAGLWMEANGWGLFTAIAVVIAVARLKLASHQLARLSLLHLLAGWLITLLLPGVYDPDLDIHGAGLEGIFRALQEAGRWISELWPILALTVLAFLSKPERRFRR